MPKKSAKPCAVSWCNYAEDLETDEGLCTEHTSEWRRSPECTDEKMRGEMQACASLGMKDRALKVYRLARRRFVKRLEKLDDPDAEAVASETISTGPERIDLGTLTPNQQRQAAKALAKLKRKS